MDNITHTLLGITLSKAGLNKKVPHAAVLLMIGANLPDVDTVSGFWGNLAYLKYHRGITHSFLGVTVLALALAGVAYGLYRRSQKKNPSKSPPSFMALLWVCLIGTWSHLLLDFTNSYGVRPFMPFSDRWVAWDIEFIIDPVILGILLCGLLLPLLFRLISEEVGAVKRRQPGRGGAVAALVLIVSLWALRDYNHRVAISKMSAFTYREETPNAVFAMPEPGNPFQWNGIVETDDAYFSMRVGPGFSATNASQAQVFYKPGSSDALRVAQSSNTGKVFLGFARIPIYTLEKRGDSVLVTIRDLRFASATRRRRGFNATILVGKDLQVLNQRFRFAG
ncbi:MAG: metal-dependent hydrolase [Acidobacteriia bacterium]|nr:metal-dependent hydrolase [Terriglobia bacterium]